MVWGVSTDPFICMLVVAKIIKNMFFSLAICACSRSKSFTNTSCFYCTNNLFTLVIKTMKMLYKI